MSKDKLTYLRDAEKVVRSLSSDQLYNEVINMLKSSNYDIKSRRKFLNHLRKIIKESESLELYPGKFITVSQMDRIRTHNWCDYLAAIVEIAADTGGPIKDIVARVDRFLVDVGDEKAGSFTSYQSLGIISGILLLCGYDFSRSRGVVGHRVRILSKIPGTELMSLEQRTSMGIARAIAFGLMDKRESDIEVHSIDELI